jgi:hypothetical protein
VCRLEGASFVASIDVVLTRVSSTVVLADFMLVGGSVGMVRVFVAIVIIAVSVAPR